MHVLLRLRGQALAGAALFAGLLCLLVTPMASAAPATPSLLPGTVSGSAYAGYAFASGPISLSVGPLFSTALSCSAPTSSSVSAASLSLGSFATSGTLSDTMTVTRTPTTVDVVSASHLQNLNVLGGLITADAINSIAHSVADTSTASSTNDSTFTNLVVASQNITGTPAPNTRINLPGLGFVMLNEQAGVVNSADATSIAVYAVDVWVTTSNLLGLPVGARVILGFARSGFSRATPADTVAAYSWGAYASGLTGEVTAGPFSPIGVGCAGGGNTATLVSASVPLVLSLGTMTSHASGSVAPGGSSAMGQAQIANVIALLGALHAQAITVTANASRTGSTYAGSATVTLTGAKLGLLTNLPTNPAPNTRITIPLLGYAYLNEQSVTVTGSSVKVNVNAIDIYLLAGNSLELPAGARIIIGHADAAVNS